MRLRAPGLTLLALTFSACAIFIPYRVGPASDVRVVITPEQVALGKKLAEGILACGSCHTTGSYAGEPRQDMYLGGDMVISELEGAIYAPNITPDREAGIGSWTDGEIIRAITKGVNRDNKQMVPLMPWPAFGATLTEEEVHAIVAYLRTVPAPVNNPRQPPDLTGLTKIAMATGMVYNMFTKSPAFAEYEPRTDTPVERGERLAYLGNCIDCHNYTPKFPGIPKFGQPLAGGIYLRKPGGTFVMCANLTPDVATGIGGFTDEQVYNSIKFGKRLRPRPETEMVRWPMIGRIPHHVALTDEEIAELIAYFRAQPAIEHDIDSKEAALNAAAAGG